MATLVKFYREVGGILAVFPQLKEFNGYRVNNTCFSIVGEHATANKDYWSKLQLATQGEYQDTADILESRGYRLKILNKL